MSIVYLAHQSQGGHQVAIKENADKSLRAQEQFFREAVILTKLNHPNLPKVTDFFIESSFGLQYLVMNYIPGDNLGELLKQQKGPLPEHDVLKWIEQVMDALKYMHEWIDPDTKDPYQIIHRDIKPRNIIRTPKGQIFLVDFGLVKFNTIDEQTRRGAVGVSDGYSPIEQYNDMGSGTDERSDIYALGATLYHLLTGIKPPTSTKRLAEPLLSPYELNPKLDLNTAKVILQAIEVNSSDRYRSIAEMYEALFGSQGPSAQADDQTTYLPPNPFQSTGRWSSGILFKVIGIVLAMIAIYSVLRITSVQQLIGGIPQIATMGLSSLWESSPSPTSQPDLLTLTRSLTPIITVVPTLLTPTLTLPTSLPSNTSGKNAEQVQDNDCPVGMRVIEGSGYRFCLDIFEVTNQEYQDCVNSTVCVSVDARNYLWPFDDQAYSDPSNKRYRSFPVVNIPVEQARNYCEEYPKTKKDGERHPKRLPTFEEWLLAHSQVDSMVVISHELYTVNVEVLDRSSNGIVGLAGNVKEWVIADTEDGQIIQALAMGKSFQDPSRFPQDRSQLHNFAVVVGDEVSTTARSDWGFRCAAEPLP